MEKKFGTYICTGCGIGEALDIEALNEAAKEEGMETKNHEAFCSAAGRELIENDIKNEGINTVNVCACSRRVMSDEFNFGNEIITVRGNIREGAAWIKEKPSEEKDQETIDEYTNELGADIVRMACAEAKKVNLPEPYKLETMSKRILVIGGGIAGITSALEASKAGYEVLLIEKEAELGGKAMGWLKQFPTKPPYESLEDPVVGSLVAAAKDDSNIEIRTSTEVARIGGMPGDYYATLKDAGTTTEWDAPYKVGIDEQDKIDKGEMEDPNKGYKHYMEVHQEAEKVGAVVLATGWFPADVSEYEHLGYSGSDKVVTNAEFEKMAKEGKLNGIGSVAFIQSPGGEEHDKDFPYCNSVTSMVALKQAKYIREANPDSRAYILYQHMRTPGHMEMFYKGVQQDDGIFFTKSAVTGVEDNGSNCTVKAKDTLLGEDLDLDVDLVVLAAGMVPTTKDAAMINLAYRQGPALSDLDLFDGYADSNFICFPYETRRTGIYSCGGVRKTTTIEETMDDATGAALKAIQCLESADRGVAVHPRSEDQTYPDFFFQRCTQCKRCTEECPFGAIDDDEKGTPKPNYTRCRRCGTCMGACPERIISFANYSIDSVGSMVKSIEVPDDDEDKLRILVFACENDAYPCLDMAAMRRHSLNSLIRVIPVRCLGSVNMSWIKDGMSAGMDGALLLGCKYGDDYQCHFAKGSELAQKRMDNIGETLGQLGLEPERCAVRQVAINEYDKVSEVIEEFVEEILELGANPFKGF